MRYLLLLLFLVVTPVKSWTQLPPEPINSCQTHAQYGFPKTDGTIMTICRSAYVVGYDGANRTTAWSVYTLNPYTTLGCFPRTNSFTADDSIGNSPTPSEYTNTGYDRGHLVPNSDMDYSLRTELESFIMTNIVAQNPTLNRGAWKLLEVTIRGWTVQLQTPIVVYSGAIYNLKDKTIGRGIKVPHAFYKIAINTKTNEAAAWIFANTADRSMDLVRRRVPVSEVERQTGIKFGMPKEYREINPGEEWPVNFGALIRQKKSKCDLERKHK
jgi:endonuclease G